VMLAVSDLRVDPRIEREARALATAGYRIVVIWPDVRPISENPQKPIDWGDNITFHGLPIRTSAFAYSFPGFLGYDLTKAALRYNPFAFHAHDLTTAFAALIAANKAGTKLVVDFHEWFSENVSFNQKTQQYVPHPRWTKAAHRWLEKKAMRRADAVITVCGSLASAMKEFSGIADEVYVVRNIPDLSRVPTRIYGSLRDELNLADDRFLLLWQGGVGPSRMIEPIIQALPLAEKCVFAIRGPGLEAYGAQYRALAEQLSVGGRLVFLPLVPSSDVVAAAQGADAGVWTLPNLCKNFYYALPNKIFEYLATGLPVLVANYPEAEKLVVRSGAGLSFDPYDPRSIAEVINRISGDPDLRQSMRQRVAELLVEIDATEEWSKLVKIYMGLGARGVESPLLLSPRAGLSAASKE